MTRIIPSRANFSFPDPTRAVADQRIEMGSATNSGRLRDLGQTVNLGHATAQADTAYAQSWVDGQFVYNAGAAFVERLRVRICKASDVHLALYCSARAYSHIAPHAGKLRFTCVGNGNTTTIALAAPIVGPIPASTTARSVLDLTGGFVAHAGGDYAEITVEISDACTVESIFLQYRETSGGLYPAADESMSAGVAADGFVPHDSDEVAFDAPVSADWLTRTIRSGIDIIRQRQRNLFVWSGINDVYNILTQNTRYRFPAPMRHYFVAPVVANDSQGGRIGRIWFRADATGGEVGLTVRTFLQGAELFSKKIAAGAALAWYTGEFTLAGRRDLDAPADYPSFLLCYIVFDHQNDARSGTVESAYGDDWSGGAPVVSVNNRFVDSIAIWGV